jgi:hypothetical protein
MPAHRNGGKGVLDATTTLLLMLLLVFFASYFASEGGDVA